MRGGRMGLAPPLRWRGSLLAWLRIIWFCWSLRIINRGLYELSQISCCSCCESVGILADRIGSFSFWSSESLQIHSDPRRSICRGAATWFPSPSDVSNLCGKYERRGEYFSSDLVQCDGTSWQLLAGVVPLTGLPWIPPCPGAGFSKVPKLFFYLGIRMLPSYCLASSQGNFEIVTQLTIEELWISFCFDFLY